MGPCWPCAPCGPAGPTGPEGPVSPAGPEGPCGPVQADKAIITIAAGMVTNCRITPVRLVPIGNLAARNKCAQSVILVCPPLEGNSNRSCDRERGCAKQKCIAVVAIGHCCVQSRGGLIRDGHRIIGEPC